MRFPHAAAFAVLGVALGLMAVHADAAPRRYYDMETRSFKTFDPDVSRQQALGAVPRSGGFAIKQYAKPDKKFDRQVVKYETTEAPGTIIIDTAAKFLYFVQGDGKALRMGVGVGREGFGWTGTVHVGMKRENPTWFPPPEMVKRQPELAKYAKSGMEGGDGNPLGVRALYLYDKGRDTLYRIHGTIEPYSIGQNVSSGCIRMLNENVTELYDLVPIGTKVIVM
jgi:lipoprotein-anchoring transpeptidase ErfK/SrfK